MSRVSNTVKCKYCDETGLYWTRTKNGWALTKLGAFHNCPKRPGLPKQKVMEDSQRITGYDFDDQGNRVYADIGYTPLPHVPAVGAYEENQAQKEYEDWAALQQHLKRILE